MSEKAWINDGYSRIPHTCVCSGLNDQGCAKSSGYMTTTNPGRDCEAKDQCKAKPDMWQVREALKAAGMRAATYEEVDAVLRKRIRTLQQTIAAKDETIRALEVGLSRTLDEEAETIELELPDD